MVRFRNVLVHLYVQVDVGRVYDNLQNRLDDFGQFAQHVVRFLAQAQSSPEDSATGV